MAKRLTQTQIDEFKRIWLKEFGEEISDSEAIEHGTKLIELFKLIYKPTISRSSELPDNQDSNVRDVNHPRVLLSRQYQRNRIIELKRHLDDRCLHCDISRMTPETPPRIQSNELYLTLSGLITDQNVIQLIEQIDPLFGQQKVNHLYLLMNTPGGGVNAGITLYNYLRAIPIKVTTHNIGQTDSIGNVIFLAGEERFASPATSFLFHGVTLTVQGSGIVFNRVHLQERLSQMSQDERRIKTIITERTKLKDRKLNDFFRSGRSLSPSEAMAFGIITEIRDVRIPDNAQRGIVNTFPIQNQS